MHHGVQQTQNAEPIEYQAKLLSRVNGETSGLLTGRAWAVDECEGVALTAVLLLATLTDLPTSAL